jgi:phosphoribosyl-ATP pyrophosphohydrolase/phosphoribosyl-AMP cyclohydrolase
VTPQDIDALDWDKGEGLLPAIIQDSGSGRVLMTGYVNRDALASMLERHEVVLYSRTRQRLWVKGETSGNRILVERIMTDCDRDALLVLGRPCGPVCHTGAVTCFGDAQPECAAVSFLASLDRIVADRIAHPIDGSYTAELLAQGIRRIAQKVGEEAVEVVLAAGVSQEELVAESADLLFHLIVLLQACGVDLTATTRVLEKRHATQYFRQPA